MTGTQKPALAFAVGDQVRVQGTTEEQLYLYGREVAGAVGIIVRPTRRSQGHNRYLVHVPRHIYVTQVKQLERPIKAHDTVIREEHLERVPAGEGIRVCRGCGCTDEWGCDEGCAWVEANLCSSCA